MGGLTNAVSGRTWHYAPTVEQERAFSNILNELGIRTKNAWLELGDDNFTPSGYVNITPSSIIVEQLK